MIPLLGLLLVLAWAATRTAPRFGSARLYWHAAALAAAVGIRFLEYPELGLCFFATYAVVVSFRDDGRSLPTSAGLAAIGVAAALLASRLISTHWLFPLAGSWLLFRAAFGFFVPKEGSTFVAFILDAAAAAIAVSPGGIALGSDAPLILAGALFAFGARRAAGARPSRTSTLALGWLVAARLFVYGLVPFEASLLFAAAIVAIAVASFVQLPEAA